MQECYAVLHKVYINPFIFWGNLADPPQIMAVHLKDIIAHSKQEVFDFYQYSNTVEST
jgi:hypothetical protein